MSNTPQLSTDSEELRKRFMDPCRLGSEADWWARRRIEELEREVGRWKNVSANMADKDDAAKEVIAEVKEDRDALIADNERLREAGARASVSLGAFVSDEGWSQADMDNMDNLDAVLAATPAQSLARLRNQAREECAELAILTGRQFNEHGIAAAIRATKEPE